MRKLLVVLAVALACTSVGWAKDYPITDFGAIGDGATLCTTAIQKAIDRCNAEGGGRVVVPNGVFVSGTIYMRSGVELHLEINARIVATTNLADLHDIYENNLRKKGLIHCESVSDVALTGFGTLDGNGNHPVFLIGGTDPGRTYVLFVKGCSRVRVSDVTLTNPSFWTFRIYDSEQVFVRGIRIYSHANLNNDGIDIDGRNIVVSDCIIDATDDALCIKSDDPVNLCENVTVTNCVIASNCNAIKFGTPGKSGFRNITISNCAIKTPAENDFFNYGGYVVPGITTRIANNSGISLECVDGGIFEKVILSDITMNDVHTPIFIRFSNRSKSPQYMKDIILTNIVANSTSLMTSSITGLEGHRVENVVISNVIFNVTGGGRIDHFDRTVPENEKAYPENRMLGSSLPAYGFYIRHAKGITLDNLRFNLAETDQRAALWVEDVEDIRMERIVSSRHDTPQPYLVCRDADRVSFSGFGATCDVPLLLRAERSRHIVVMYNDLSRVGKITEKRAHPGIEIQYNIFK